jgi:hypothetical protein
MSCSEGERRLACLRCSPGRVLDGEKLYRVIVAPPDMEQDQLLLTSLTQAEQGGLSVLREAAADAEFVHVAKARLARRREGQEGRVIGVAEFTCSEVRRLKAADGALGRAPDDRLFCVYDVDLPPMPLHADIFLTSPRGLSKTQRGVAWKEDRERLLRVVSTRVIAASDFRGGILQTLNK